MAILNWPNTISIPSMKYKNSDIIIPVSILAHLFIINVVFYFLTPDVYMHDYSAIYYSGSWLFICYILNFYPTDRQEFFWTRFHKFIQVIFVYYFSYFAFFVFINKLPTYFLYNVLVLTILFFSLLWYRVLFYWVRGKFRIGGRNYIRVVVLGRDRNLKKIRKVFDNPNYGYRYMGYFSESTSKSPTYLGDIMECFGYILNHDVDEIYCVASQFREGELKNFVNFADNNLIRFKVILDDMDMFNRAMTIESYNLTPVLNFRKLPLDTEISRILKRSFDLVFSSLVILFLLSWLTPLLYLIIKLESPGDVFFKQLRHGLKRRTFYCYKFRTMTDNMDSDQKMASKNDMRITKVGAFLRKTSIDELPQFFNVLKGEMSVVGPRPHMVVHTQDFEKSVNKYLVRHFVKPGITGLAQIRGFRGEILEPADINHRTRLDIFYVEKWSLELDIRIIFDTVYNVFKGEEKAY